MGAGLRDNGPLSAPTLTRWFMKVEHARPMNGNDLIACHDCDALLRKPRYCGKGSARCPRCDAILHRPTAVQLERICALTLAALFTFLIAQAFPIVELEVNGVTSQTTLIGALAALWGEGMQLVAVAVFCSTILFPLIELIALLYVLVPIRAGVVPPGFNQVLRAIQFVRPWGMIEVLMLGILVTIVKMTSLARVIPEAALFAFGALTLMLAVVVLFNPRALWDIADIIGKRNARDGRDTPGTSARHRAPPAASPRTPAR
jgi:paraquat-inducible protein A